MRYLVPLILFLSIVFTGCKSKERELWIEHTMHTIAKGDEALEHLDVMRKILSSKESFSENEYQLFNETKVELEYLVEETSKLVADNPAQVAKLDEIKGLLFKIYFRDVKELESERASILEKVDEVEGLIDSYIEVEEKLLKMRKKA